jgi:hypothetical protein
MYTDTSAQVFSVLASGVLAGTGYQLMVIFLLHLLKLICLIGTVTSIRPSSSCYFRGYSGQLGHFGEGSYRLGKVEETKRNIIFI